MKPTKTKRQAKRHVGHRRPRPESESCSCIENTAITVRNGVVGVYNGYITAAEFVARMLGFSC